MRKISDCGEYNNVPQPTMGTMISTFKNYEFDDKFITKSTSIFSVSQLASNENESKHSMFNERNGELTSLNDWERNKDIA